jgi:methyl-accepting chemotaxis protein
MQALEALRGEGSLKDAIIFHGNRPFARYRHVGRDAGAPPTQPRAPGVYFEGGSVLVFQPVWLEGQQIGTVSLKAASQVGARLGKYIGIVCLVLVFSLLLSMLASSRMQGTIVDPIAELSRVAQRVSVDKNYAVRATRVTPDSREPAEIALLFDSFNEMLSRIEHHERDRLAAAESLRESEERYSLAARGANDGLWDWKFARQERNLFFIPLESDARLPRG